MAPLDQTAPPADRSIKGWKQLNGKNIRPSRQCIENAGRGIATPSLKSPPSWANRPFSNSRMMCALSGFDFHRFLPINRPIRPVWQYSLLDWPSPWRRRCFHGALSETHAVRSGRVPLHLLWSLMAADRQDFVWTAARCRHAAAHCLLSPCGGRLLRFTIACWPMSKWPLLTGP